MHTIHCDVLKKKPWSLKQAGNDSSSHATLQVLRVANHRRTMWCRRPEVDVVLFVGTAHPAKLRTARPWEAKGLGQPFPIASHLQQGKVGDQGMSRNAFFDIFFSEGCAIVPESRALAQRKTSEAPSNDIHQLLVGVKPHAAVAKLGLRDNEQNVSLIPNRQVG